MRIEPHVYKTVGGLLWWEELPWPTIKRVFLWRWTPYCMLQGRSAVVALLATETSSLQGLEAAVGLNCSTFLNLSLCTGFFCPPPDPRCWSAIHWYGKLSIGQTWIQKILRWHTSSISGRPTPTTPTHTQTHNTLHYRVPHFIPLQSSTSKVVLVVLPFGWCTLWQRLHLVHRRASRVRLYLMYESEQMCPCESTFVGQKWRAGKEAEIHSGKSRFRLTLLKMTYQITQRTGICPCPCFTSNCFIISRVCGFRFVWKMS